ncbi:hypothetical protein N1851_017603 [Merluccius polli]|uniref:Uncharacterized protein n=1 Tax=Merluccius polli TaxID=89951 RepID=A0AA47P146_MERPO|nr:hypothetical protein N1851_017603 [Merluccius polli]
MPNNRCVAEQRAANLKKKLSKNSDLHNEYREFMSDLLGKSYAVEVLGDASSNWDWSCQRNCTISLTQARRAMESSPTFM